LGDCWEWNWFVVEASKPDQFETAFEAARKGSADGILVLGDPLIFIHSGKVVGVAARYQLPAMYLNQRNVQDGGLMSYGPNTADFWRHAGTYVDKILKGERPRDLPVQQPTRFYLLVNLKTAAALGITIPPSILAQADEMIE
jgi:putative tryptophan/tyrosine transport system substrate-binding protein